MKQEKEKQWQKQIKPEINSLMRSTKLMNFSQIDQEQKRGDTNYQNQE